MNEEANDALQLSRDRTRNHDAARYPLKKIAVFLAVALIPALGAAAQDVSSELYGNFRYAYAYAGAEDAAHWASANNASRLGIRGDISEQSLTAFFDLQTGVNIDAEELSGALTQRYYVAGVRGAFGAVTVGRQSTAYKMAGLRLDPFYDTSTLSAGGGVPQTGLFAGASFGLSNLTNGFADRTVAYTSPRLGGITANAAVYLDPDSDHGYGAGLGYRGRGIDAGLQYYDAGGDPTWAQAAGIDHGLRLHAGYGRADAWSVGASYERVDAVADPAQDFLYAAGTVNVTPHVLLAGAVGYVEDSSAFQPVTGTGYHVGVFYSLLQPVRLHALFSYLEADRRANRSSVALGLTIPFAINP